MKDLKDKKILFVTFIALLLLLTTGLSYAYFSTSVSGNDNAKDVVVETGTLKLVYTDSPEIVANNIKPGWTTTKVVTVKNNGTLDTVYNLVWQELTNEIANNEMVISATCERLNSSNTVEGTCAELNETAINENKIKTNISIESGITHKYTFTITFKEINAQQDYNQNKKFNGVIGVEEYKNTAIYCTYDGELKQGAEKTNGQYTYRYMQEGKPALGLSWNNITADGWGVQLTDKTSTDAVTSELCTYINNKPVVSMSSMFYGSKATTIDVSNFDTSNVTNMSEMFSQSQATILNLSSFDTSKVTDMGSMFWSSQSITIKGLESFDTSNVTDMGSMFSYSQATTLDLSNFDTSNVTDMGSMFDTSQATTIKGLESFDTSNVTDMSDMFLKSQATKIDVSNFDTSKVYSMSYMFQACSVTTLDLSNFDTSNVTDMSKMFYNNSNLKTIYVSNKFNTEYVTDSANMFDNCPSLVGGSGTTYDSTKVDKTYARIDGGTSNPGYFTAK